MATDDLSPPLPRDGLELMPTTLSSSYDPSQESIYCQSIFLDLEIIPIYRLLEFEENEQEISMIGKFQYRIKDSTSVYLRVSGVHGVINLVLDVQTHISALPLPPGCLLTTPSDNTPALDHSILPSAEDEMNPSNNILRSYIYTRFGERYRLNILHYGQMIDEILENEYATFNFFLQQFCRFYETANPRLDLHPATADNHKREVNVVARGVESTGFFFRQGLKGSGKAAGDLIRYMGQPSHSNGEGNSSHEATSLLQQDNRKHLTEEEIAAEEKRAEYYKQQAETIHSYAKTATSAIMLPIRMIGRKAVELAKPNAEEEQGWKRAIMDTVGGCGNGIMSVAKGFTEGLQEMGVAIEEVAMQRAIEKYGPEYAERVTRKYLSAGSEGCRAAIKTVSVASMGFHGFVAGMAVEGVDYAVNLKDYLVGPVILQNYLQVLQYPLTKSVRYFTVLRPWCLAFYYHHSEFASKPHKIIATSNLDTIPKLREERIRDSVTGEYVMVNYIEISTLDGSTYALRLDAHGPDLIGNMNWFNSVDVAPAEYRSSTVSTNGSDVILEWYRQIQDGSRRMETIRKHNSGATELREERWLRRSPRGVGWKWNGDVPEVIIGDYIFTFKLHNLYLSTDQLREAIEFEPNQLAEAELVNANGVITISPEVSASPFTEELEVTTPEQEDLISSFVEMNLVSRDEAKSTLQRVNWDINRALDESAQEHDLLGLSEVDHSYMSPSLPSSPPNYHTVVAVPIDGNISENKKVMSCTPNLGVKSTAKAMKANVKADITCVNVTIKLVTHSGLKIKVATTEWENLTSPNDHNLIAGRGSYRHARWLPAVVIKVGSDMRVHRDTCSSIELIITANTKVGLRYKVGICTLDMETLTDEGGQLGSILLPIYRMRKGPLHDSSFTIGEMNVDISREPYSTSTEI